MQQALAALYTALPLINILAVVVLTALHVKNANAIASAGTTLIGDVTGPTPAAISKIATDAHAAGIALGLNMQVAAPASVTLTKETTHA